MFISWVFGRCHIEQIQCVVCQAGRGAYRRLKMNESGTKLKRNLRQAGMQRQASLDLAADSTFEGFARSGGVRQRLGGGGGVWKTRACVREPILLAPFEGQTGNVGKTHLPRCDVLVSGAKFDPMPDGGLADAAWALATRPLTSAYSSLCPFRASKPRHPCGSTDCGYGRASRCDTLQ